ncbi:MAG TPA: class I adenylate-forming enzyme family protein [Pseudolabrys sp.]|nr:class I adenylate-forming enzyme family protein [Pseudolabrys sp.]
MILSGTANATGNRATLDDLFRRAGVRHSDGLALADPPNCELLNRQPPRCLTYAEADRAISTLAAKLRALGLQTDAVVAIQLANTIDSVIALLGVLRAGMIAAPLPLLWRVQEAVSALSAIGAKAIITCAHAGAYAQAEIAMQAAAELFPIRYVCGFGDNLPDGVVPLDERADAPVVDFYQPATRPGDAAAHVAAITFDITAEGFVPRARSHRELIAGGLAAFLEGGIARDAAILSAIPATSFAGIALTVVPWLLSGGTLGLHHGFDPAVFAEQTRALQPAAVVLPAPALTPLTQAGLLDEPVKTILGLWRAPEQIAGAASWQGNAVLIDVASFGEIGLLPARRGSDGRPAPLPLGLVAVPHGSAETVAVAETTRNKTGTLMLRGPMVPTRPFPPIVEPGGEDRFAPDGFVDTGYGCKISREAGAFTLTAPPSGITAVGFYRFRQSEVDAVVATADPSAVIVALPDAHLGQRLAGRARDGAAIAAELEAYGVNALVAGAFRLRGIAA